MDFKKIFLSFAVLIFTLDMIKEHTEFNEQNVIKKFYRKAILQEI